MDSYRKYLSEQILAEDKVITYRILSRALKVHVNTAKQMLYDFHKWQNNKGPGSVRATYLVYGTKKEDEAKPQVQADGDVEMTSSMPEAESLADVAPVYSLSIVREGQLQDALAQYDEVSSIHVYSLGPHPMSDPALLFDATRQLVKFSAGHDASGSQNSHGVIVNPGVRRKERKGAGAKLADASTKAAEEVAPKVKAEPQAAAESSKAKAETPSSSAAAKKSIPSLKRGGSSGIMESFAKAAAKPKKKETPQPATPSGAAEEESSTRAMSDDGEDDAELLPKPRSGAGRKSRKDREEELRRMMDDNEDEDEEPEVKADSPDEEPVEEEPVEEEPGPPEAEKEELAEMVSVSTGDGRRRGKRRVMRKKQIMDEQGYLVTIQEPGWESFSEDESTPASQSKPTSSAQEAQAGKTKKGGGASAPKGSQGNIMSFFSKK